MCYYPYGNTNHVNVAKHICSSSGWFAKVAICSGNQTVNGSVEPYCVFHRMSHQKLQQFMRIVFSSWHYNFEMIEYSWWRTPSPQFALDRNICKYFMAPPPHSDIICSLNVYHHERNRFHQYTLWTAMRLDELCICTKIRSCVIMLINSWCEAGTDLNNMKLNATDHSGPCGRKNYTVGKILKVAEDAQRLTKAIFGVEMIPFPEHCYNEEFLKKRIQEIQARVKEEAYIHVNSNANMVPCAGIFILKMH